jgi:hypothetical protein
MDEAQHPQETNSETFNVAQVLTLEPPRGDHPLIATLLLLFTDGHPHRKTSARGPQCIFFWVDESSS